MSLTNLDADTEKKAKAIIIFQGGEPESLYERMMKNKEAWESVSKGVLKEKVDEFSNQFSPNLDVEEKKKIIQEFFEYLKKINDEVKKT